ncbi:MAG: PAS domain S-box protein [Kiritimatiellia bacterium]
MTRKRILVVEDEQIVAHDICQRLERMGYDALGPVASGDDVMPEVDRLKPDLVLMDIFLSGGTDGVKAADDVRERFAIPVVYLTAYSNEETLDRAKRTAPFGFVHKPVADHELRAALEMALYKHEWDMRLRRSDEMLAVTLRNLGDAVFTTDHQGRVEYMNRMAQRVSGWSLEEAQGKTIDEVLSINDDRTKVKLNLNPDGPTGHLKTARAIGNCSLATRDGRSLQVEISMNSLAGTDLAVSGLVILVRDISERERARREIEQLHKQLEFVLAETRTNIDIIDSQFNLRYVDPVWQRLYGDYTNRKCYEYFMGRGEPCLNCGIIKALQSESIVISDEVLPRENNRSVQVTTVPYKSDDNEWLVAELNMDLTERKRLEKEMIAQRDLALELAAADSLEKAMEVFLHATREISSLECAAICLCGDDGVEMRRVGAEGFPQDFDAMFERLAPDPASDQGRRLLDGQPVYLDASKSPPNFIMRGFTNNSHLRAMGILPIRHRDRLIGVCCLASTQMNEVPVNVRGMLDLMISQVSNVIGRLRAELKVRESDNQYRHLFDNAPVGYHEIDMHGVLVRVNRTELEMLGYKPEEMVGRHVWDFIEDREQSRSAVLAKLKSGAVHTQSYELVFLRRDGVPVPVLAREYAIYDEKGRMLGIRTALQDITEQKKGQADRLQFESRMHELQKLESIGLLAGGIAHDFNNLLMGIQGNAELALMKAGEGAAVDAFLQDIKNACRRASELTGQLLAYAGKGKYVIDVLDLSQVVRAMEQLLHTIIGQKADLQLVLADGLPGVEGDGSQLRQVIMNLITNAVEALSDRQGTIRIVTDTVQIGPEHPPSLLYINRLPPGTYCRLQICDTGCGMSPEQLSRLFQPFYTTKFIGRGLGLAAVLGIVRNHNGDIEVTSDPGRGSCFAVLLPTVATPPDRPEGSALSETQQASGMILLVDDDDAILRLVSRYLEGCGMHVLKAADGPDALDLFKQHAAALRAVVLDITLPRMNGDEVFRRMRRINDSIPVLFSSGYSEGAAIQGMETDQGVHFIQKPYELPDLKSRLFDIMRTVESEVSS